MATLDKNFKVKNGIDVTGAITANSATIGEVSNTELQYLNGVTSAIQTQLDDKSTASKTETLTNKTLTSPEINLSINTQTGTTYIPVFSDNGKLVTLNNASAITLTVPTNDAVSYATGAQINLLQLGEGQVTVVGDTGVTVYSTPGANFRAQYSAATLIKLNTDTWLLTGDLGE